MLVWPPKGLLPDLAWRITRELYSFKEIAGRELILQGTYFTITDLRAHPLTIFYSIFYSLTLISNNKYNSTAHSRVVSAF